MKTNRTQYFFREGIKNIGKNRFMSVASIGTSFATLFILGAFLLLVLNINGWAQQLAKDCQIQVFVHEDTSKETYDKVGEKISRLIFVDKVEQYTKKDIFNEMKAALKADENGSSVLEGFSEEDNPYRDSYKITVTDPEQTAYVTKIIQEEFGFKEGSKIKFGNEGLNVVAKITNSQETVDKIMDIGKTVQKISIWCCQRRLKFFAVKKHTTCANNTNLDTISLKHLCDNVRSRCFSVCSTHCNHLHFVASSPIKIFASK